MRVNMQKKLMNQSWQSFISRSDHWNKRWRQRIVIMRTLRKLSSVRFLTASCVILASSFSLELCAADRTLLITVDVSILRRAVERRAESPCFDADVNYEALGSNVRILNAIELEAVLHREMGSQSNDIPNSNMVDPQIMPQREREPHLDRVGDIHTASLPRQMEDLQPDVPDSNPEIIPEHDDGDNSTPPTHLMEGLHLDVPDSNPVPDPNTVVKIMPQQGAGPHSNIVSDGGSTAFVILNSNSAHDLILRPAESRPSDSVSIPCVSGTRPELKQATHQHSTGDNSDVNVTRVAPPSCYLSFPSPLGTFGRYTCSKRRLIFFLSTVIAFIAVAIQYQLGPEMPRTGLRPGWVRHRNEGWKREAPAR